MLHDPQRHEPCTSTPWNEAAARAAIARIVRDAEAGFVPGRGWPKHPRDGEVGPDPLAAANHALYHGGAGVAWALHYLQAVGAATLVRDYADEVPAMLARDRATRVDDPELAHSYLLGDTGLLLLQHALRPTAASAAALAATIEANADHPARELMLGAPGTLLAALFLHEREGGEGWQALFRAGVRRLEAQLEWSEEFGCAWWPQVLFGRPSSYLDAVHGFVATASMLIRGRGLLAADEWARWQATIETTIRRTARLEDGRASWRTQLHEPPGPDKRLMQYCHGAPGFVICLADLPGTALDVLLVAGGEATWHAGPLRKGSNLCHGTAGNGYAFLALHARTGEPRWLERARAFAMHAIAQCEAEAAEVGRPRHSLWTGDLGLAVYLHDCLRARAAFPTLDVFFFG
jgi:hypothetical protein